MECLTITVILSMQIILTWWRFQGMRLLRCAFAKKTDDLLEIIVTFLQTGKPCEKYEWLETEE